MSSSGADKAESKAKPTSRWHGLAVLLAVGYICFIFGAFVAQFHVAPFYDMLVPAFRAMVALRESAHGDDPGVLSSPWQLTRRQGKGVTRFVAGKASEGYTFLTTGAGPEAVLINMWGKRVHEWRAPFSAVWPEALHLPRQPIEDKIAWPRALLFPNGDILAVYTGGGITPWGCGLARLDKDSNVIWRYSQAVHHEVSVGEDGNIYTLTHAIRHDKVDWLTEVYPPYLDDSIVVLTPEGKEAQTIGILAAFRESPYQALLQEHLVADAKGDLLHANSVKLVSRAFADKASFAEPGQILVSLRTPSMLAIIDPKTERVVWAIAGPWAWQHDPDLLESGNILLFDNLSMMPEERSRVLEYDPKTTRVVWEYGAAKKQRFYSHFWGTQQRLPNGNVMVTESAAGRILELAPDRTLVWEWLNPQQKGDFSEFRAVVYSAVRFTADELPFLEEKE